MARDTRLYATFALNFPSNAKIAILSDAAFRAWVEMVCWSREQLTDGRIPQEYAVRRWGQPILDELSTNHPDRPTLTRLGGGEYFIHDFAQHQITTAQIASLRKQEISAKRAAAGRASGAARRAMREQTTNKRETNPQQRPEQNGDLEAPKAHVNGTIVGNKPTNANTETETETETETKKDPPTVGPKSGEIATCDQVGKVETKPRRAKPTRTPIDPDWWPSRDAAERMKAKYSHLNLRAEREAFINHHTARGNLMADWTAAFWTWLNNTRKFGSNGGRQLQGADKSVIEWEQYKEPEQTQGAIE